MRHCYHRAKAFAAIQTGPQNIAPVTVFAKPYFAKSDQAAAVSPIAIATPPWEGRGAVLG